MRVLWITLFELLRQVRCQVPTNAENTTEVLDKLLKNYRKEIRPGFGGDYIQEIFTGKHSLLKDVEHILRRHTHGNPLLIETDMLIRSMGQISESDMDYSFQCYFRQRWTDERLRFDIYNITEVTLNNLFLSDIWKPNTYFLNGHKSHQHNIPTPNLFVRIRNDGRVYLSRRLTVKASCPMKLNLYPMDRPMCSLILGSYGYTTSDIQYLWKYGNQLSVEVVDDVRLAQYDIIGIKTGNHTEKTLHGDFSLLQVYIYFERHIGFFILQTYLPCSMITCLSWVSFWINRDAAPARVLLGVTTILATAGIGMTVREGLPRVSYATALDMYLNVCIVYEMAAMMEYAAVNYFTKVLPLEGGVDSEEEPDPPDQSVRVYLYQTPEGVNGCSSGTELESNLPRSSFKLRSVDSCRRKRRTRRNTFGRLFLKCLTGNMKYRSQLRQRGNTEAGNAVSNIDMWCRYLFPLTFIMFNIFYWLSYLIIL